MSLYSTLKAAWHLDRIEDMRMGRPTVPIELQLILSDLCNHDCHFCAYRASNGLSSERFVEYAEDGTRNHNPNRMIERGKAMEILDDAASAGVKSVIFTGGGEPSVHPEHMEIYAHALDLGLECSLNTNGVLFRKGWEDILPRFTYVRFSVDAGNSMEYASVRGCPPGHYKAMLSNLSALRDEVDKQGSACVVGTGYVVTPGNYKNLRHGINVLKDNGAHYVRIAAMQSTEDQNGYEGRWMAARNVARVCAEELPDEGFAVYDLMDGVVGERPDYEFCGFQHLVIYVGANLEVYRCCYTAYTDHGLVGSLADMSFKDYLKDRPIEPFDARSCRICPLNEKNRVISYMVDPSPKHINFV